MGMMEKRMETTVYKSLKRIKRGIIWGNNIGVVEGDTRTLDHSSDRFRAHRPIRTTAIAIVKSKLIRSLTRFRRKSRMSP